MNLNATKIERRIRGWIAQQESELSGRRAKRIEGPRQGAPTVRMPPALDLPDRERWRY